MLLVVRLSRAGRLPHHLPLTAARLISGISCGGLTGEPAALLGQQSEAVVPALPVGATQPEERLNRALYSLDLGVQQSGRVSRTQLEAAALLLAAARPNPNQALLLIRLCGAALVDLAPSARTALLDRISTSLEVAAVTAEYDVSHHNAIIRVQLDNDNPTAAAEAVTGSATVLHQSLLFTRIISGMLEAGIRPNKQTYELLLEAYCATGDETAALGVIDIMKKENFSVGERSLHCLLHCYSLTGNTAAQASLLEVMKAGGVEVGGEARTVMLCGAALATNPTMLQNTPAESGQEDTDFNLTIGQQLRVILACSKSGLFQQAKHIAETLNRQPGLVDVNDLRYYVPQIALAGNISTAVNLWLGIDDNNNVSKEKEGMFLVNAIANSGRRNRDILDSIVELEAAGYHSAMALLLIEAAQSWSKENSKLLASVIKNDDLYEITWRKVAVTNSLKMHLQRTDHDASIKLLNHLYQMDPTIGERGTCVVFFPFIGNHLIPAMLQKKQNNAKKVDFVLAKHCNLLTGRNGSNLILNSLLSQETVEAFSAAEEFLLTTAVTLSPRIWSKSLGRCYLTTRHTDILVNIIFLSCLVSTKSTQLSRDGREVFGCLAFLQRYPDCPQFLVRKAVESLVILSIGVPEGTLEPDESNSDLLDRAAGTWNRRHQFWSTKRIRQFVTKLKDSRNAKTVNE